MATPLKRKAGDIATSTAKKPKANATITSFFSSPSSAAKPAAAAASTTTSTVPSSPVTGSDDTPQKDAASTTAITASIFTSTAAAPPPAEAAAPLAKFDKGKWVEKLTPEQKDLLALEIASLDESWLSQLKDEIVTKDFLDLKRFLKKEHDNGKKIFPPAADVYSWSRHTPLNTVKCVILGQDPYHGLNQAHGLCFSVRPPTPAPPSLANIYKLLKKEYPNSFEPPPKNGGLLTPWADRGVLLLNTCLTVRAHEANSHANHGWEKFTQKVIDIVARKRTNGVVFLAWGQPAAKRVAKLDRVRHCVLQSVHPSPLSAPKGFFDCEHFRKTNAWLKERYGEDGAIDWNLNVPPEKTGV
ncbi:uracil DNA glycosylase [Imshaugia aleurites]|uniref:Uracil-DNA glycosylase n=1 Tax=Imshaugia aleurites TaxID=172621 RepID=A0A8H3I6R4_9LECA|nr:uracil DNA glycosylase [Imshaugia aleurites]